MSSCAISFTLVMKFCNDYRLLKSFMAVLMASTLNNKDYLTDKYVKGIKLVFLIGIYSLMINNKITLYH